jgi:hypothetical protein
MTCHAKISYPTEVRAENGAREREYRHGWKMEHYQCRSCGQFHLSRTLHKGSPIILMDKLTKDGPYDDIGYPK